MLATRPEPTWRGMILVMREAIRTPHFWWLFAVYVCTGLGSFFVSLHQLAFAVDVGFDPLYAASVLGLGSFLAMGGTIAMLVAQGHHVTLVDMTTGEPTPFGSEEVRAKEAAAATAV